jgi:hypothetical protein
VPQEPWNRSGAHKPREHKVHEEEQKASKQEDLSALGVLGGKYDLQKIQRGKTLEYLVFV